ncbi:hypothetical protein ACF061_06575 [Streptomyces sp. NPDC015220]|uniref:hypothetical protein n=1 Tax=Streptomyces sp. NPDC015220 TaxID=3364947 RepID=UPI0036FFE53A
MRTSLFGAGRAGGGGYAEVDETRAGSSAATAPGPAPRRGRRRSSRRLPARRTPAAAPPLGDDAVTAVLGRPDQVRGDVTAREKHTRATAFVA